MQTGAAIAERNQALAGLIRKKLNVRGQGLEQTYRRAKRSMPKWVREEIARMIEAETLLSHPKLMTRMDPAGLDSAYKRTEKWVKSVNVSERRKTFWLNLAAANGFQILVVALLVVGMLQIGGHL